MSAVSPKVRVVPTWLWLTPAAAGALPLALIGFAWFVSLLDPPPRGWGVSLGEVILLSMLFAPAAGFFALVWLAALVLLGRVPLRDRSTAATAGLAAFCVAEPVIFLILMILTHGITR